MFLPKISDLEADVQFYLLYQFDSRQTFNWHFCTYQYMAKSCGSEDSSSIFKLQNVFTLEEYFLVTVTSYRTVK